MKKMNFKSLIILVVTIILSFSFTIDVQAAEDKELEGYNFDYAYTEEDMDALFRVTMAEAGNQDFETQKMVAAVVLNRTLHEDFPSTVDEVVRQKLGKVHQFSCVPNGMYDNAKPTKQVIEACFAAFEDLVYDREVVPSNLLYFNSIGFFDWSTVSDYKQSDDMYFSTLNE